MRKVDLIIILIFSSLVGWQLLRPGYFWVQDDLHVMRLFQMNKCLADGQIPCRWSPDMGLGYGQPMFNFYSAFPYYLGAVFTVLGVSYVDAVKILFFLPIFFSGYFAYLLFKNYLSRMASLIAALAYIVAPYHILNVFVRGALAELWGMALFPLVLYSITRLVKQPTTTRAAHSTLSLAIFLTTHNITSLLCMPFIIIFTIIQFICHKRNTILLKYLLVAFVLAFGLSSFFIIPAFFETSLIQSERLTRDYFNVFIHFATIKQLLFDFHWGYGPSQSGPIDELSFFIGPIPLIALVLSPILIIWQIKKCEKEKFAVSIFFLSLTLASLFMTHGRSWLLWRSLPLLSYAQFPWRFLALVAVGTSFLIGLSFDWIHFRQKKILLSVVIALLILPSFNHFRFRDYLPTTTDRDILTGNSLVTQSAGGLLDYLPRTVKSPPNRFAPDSPTMKTGGGNVQKFVKRSNYFTSEIEVYSTSATVEFPVMYFPGWHVYINGQSEPVDLSTDNDLGLITIKLGKGPQLVQAWFENTPIRQLANLLTFFSAVTLVSWVVISNERKPQN